MAVRRQLIECTYCVRLEFIRWHPPLVDNWTHFADFEMPEDAAAITIETGKRTMDHNRYKTVDRDWQSLAVPVVLILTGLLLVTGEALGLLSGVRIENLWPIAVLLIGLGELQPDLAENRKETQRDAARR